MGDFRNYDPSVRRTIFRDGLRCRYGVSRPGLASATLGAQLVDGGAISGGLTSGGIHDQVKQSLLEPANFVPAPLISPADGGDGSVTAFGNLGRNIYRGPYQQNWDFSLIKNSRSLSGKASASQPISSTFGTMRTSQIRRSMILKPPSAIQRQSASLKAVCPRMASAIFDSTHSSFGKIFSTVGTPRLIQFSLRYAF